MTDNEYIKMQTSAEQPIQNNSAVTVLTILICVIVALVFLFGFVATKTAV